MNRTQIMNSRTAKMLVGALMLCFVLAFLTGWTEVHAASTEEANVTAEETVEAGSLPDSDDLFKGYVADLFGMEEAKPSAKKKSAKRAFADPSPRKNSLNENEKKIYDAILNRAVKLASGEESDATVSIKLSNLVDSEILYSAEELGVPSIYAEAQEGEASNTISGDAFYALLKKAGFDSDKVITALINDNPYEFYWFDKTKHCSYYTSLGWDKKNHKIGLDPIEDLDIIMCVSADYSKTGEEGTTDLDTEITSAPTTAKENADAIVTAYSSKTDIEKLRAYKTKIIGLTDYNSVAAENQNTPYGDPWQMIYVFDENPLTKVVCEGYSKAFKYLCDKSTFSDQTLKCILADGKLFDFSINPKTGKRPESPIGENHMWNIVTVKGKNYMADITNSDVDVDVNNGGRPSIADKDQLFLAGADPDDDGDYVFSWDDYSLAYSYSDDLRSIFTADELKLASTYYTEDNSGDDQGGSGSGGQDPDPTDPNPNDPDNPNPDDPNPDDPDDPNPDDPNPDDPDPAAEQISQKRQEVYDQIFDLLNSCVDIVEDVDILNDLSKKYVKALNDATTEAEFNAILAEARAKVAEIKSSSTDPTSGDNGNSNNTGNTPTGSNGSNNQKDNVPSVKTGNDPTTKVISASDVAVSTAQKAVVSGFKVKASKKKATIKWKKPSALQISTASITGFQIYRSNKKKGGFKKVGEIKSATKNKFVNKKLKKGKKYFYRMRTVSTVNGTKYYGKWSKVIKIKAK